MNVIKNLGDFNYGDIINTHQVAPFTGDYEFKYEMLGVQRKLTSPFTAGTEITFSNLLNEQVVVNFIVKFPSGYQTGCTNYVTTSDGRMIFQYKNVLSA